MVGNHAQRNILLLILMVTGRSKLCRLIEQRANRIHFKDGLDILYNNRKALKAHAGIDVLLLELGVVPVAVVVELAEDIVPDFHEAVAFPAHHVLGTGSVGFAAVIINLRAGAAWTGTVLPEIVRLAEAVNALRCDADFVPPDIEGLVIFLIDRGIETIRLESHNLGQELPAPVNGLTLEVIAEGKVTEHLKKGAVARGLTDIVDITRADTLLAGCHTATGRNLLPRKIRL